MSEWDAPDRRRSEEDELRESLAGLARLSSRRLPLRELLTRVAGLAVRAIPGADGAGLTLLEEGRSDTIVATADFVRDIDAIQYGLGQGPCITAAREAQTVRSGALGEDVRWGRFGTRSAERGVHSVVSLPLLVPDGVLGAMNVYAHAPNAFDERAAQLGGRFAEPAAVAVQNAQVLEQTRRLAEVLQRSVEERSVVERAVGIVMGRSGVDAVEAERRLSLLADNSAYDLPQIARQVIDRAVRRRARPDPTEQP